jgi:starch synthase
VRVFVPHYGLIDDRRFEIQLVDSFKMPWNRSVTDVRVSSTNVSGVTVSFIRGWPFFAPHEKFVYSQDEGIDIGRFLFFSAAGLEYGRRLGGNENWYPDIIHAHDWHTGVVPYLLLLETADRRLAQSPTVFSIHNMQYQGWGAGWHLRRAGLPPVDHPLLKAMDRADNLLAVGLAYSDMLSTVSPRYAQEIATPGGGFGLDGLVHARSLHLMGILNGIDTQRWNPATSQHIPFPYDAKTLPVRKENKLALQAELGLPVHASVPTLAAVMRLVEQKGPSIMFPAVRGLLESTEAQFVLLGSGEPSFEQAARQLSLDFPTKAAVRLTFDEPLSERIYAGADIFLMPSLFEPCGLGQMIAMSYGALPVVREVGGLADTVDAQTGFLFKDYHSATLSSILNQALDIYLNNRRDWRARQRRSMRLDFSWERSAKRYLRMYQQAIKVRRTYS